jgi:hypothetical protein
MPTGVLTTDDWSVPICQIDEQSSNAYVIQTRKEKPVGKKTVVIFLN